MSDKGKPMTDTETKAGDAEERRNRVHDAAAIAATIDFTKPQRAALFYWAMIAAPDSAETRLLIGWYRDIALRGGDREERFGAGELALSEIRRGILDGARGVKNPRLGQWPEIIARHYIAGFRLGEFIGQNGFNIEAIKASVSPRAVWRPYDQGAAPVAE